MEAAMETRAEAQVTRLVVREVAGPQGLVTIDMVSPRWRWSQEVVVRTSATVRLPQAADTVEVVASTRSSLEHSRCLHPSPSLSLQLRPYCGDRRQGETFCHQDQQENCNWCQENEESYRRRQNKEESVGHFRV